MGAARNMDIYANEDAHSDITEVSLASHQTSMTVRNARMSNPEEKTTDELSKYILREMEKLIRDKKNAEQKDKAKVLTMIKKVFVATKQALDVAYSAGVLASKTQGHAQEESLRFSASLPDKQMRG